MEERQETFQEYSATIRGPRGKSPINGSYGAYDYFKYHKHNRPKEKSYYKITEGQFYKLLRAVNQYLADLLIKEGSLDLPMGLGKLTVVHYEPELKIVDGKLKTGLPINWDATLKLWYSDKDAEKKKCLVRREGNIMHYIRYSKSAVFKNSIFYEFFPMKKVRKALLKHTMEADAPSIFFLDNTTNLNRLYHG